MKGLLVAQLLFFFFLFLLQHMYMILYIYDSFVNIFVIDNC